MKAKYHSPDKVFFQQEFEGNIRIGVNEKGIHIIDPKEMVLRMKMKIFNFLLRKLFPINMKKLKDGILIKMFFIIN